MLGASPLFPPMPEAVAGTTIRHARNQKPSCSHVHNVAGARKITGLARSRDRRIEPQTSIVACRSCTGAPPYFQYLIFMEKERHASRVFNNPLVALEDRNQRAAKLRFLRSIEDPL